MNYIVQLPVSAPLLCVFFLSFTTPLAAYPAGIITTGALYATFDNLYKSINKRVQP